MPRIFCVTSSKGPLSCTIESFQAPPWHGALQQLLWSTAASNQGSLILAPIVHNVDLHGGKGAATVLIGDEIE